MPYRIQWERYFARKFTPARYEIVMRVFYSDFFNKEFGITVQSNLVIPEHRNHAIYYDANEWYTFQKTVFRKSTVNLVAFRRYAKLITTSEKKYAEYGLNLSRNLRIISDKQLHRLWRTFDQTHLDFFNKAIWIPFLTEPLISERASKIIQGVYPPRRKPEEYECALNTVFGQEEPNAIIKSELSLLRIAIDAKSKGRISQALLGRHTKRFSFIPCYDVYDKPWTKQVFQREVRRLLKMTKKELNEERRAIQSRMRKARSEFQKLLGLFPIGDRDFLRIAHELTFIKDERDDYRRLGSFRAKPLYLELDRRLGYPKNGSLFLIHDEVEHYFASGEKPTLREIRSRMKKYLLIRKRKPQIEIVSGANIDRTIRRELGSRTVEKIKTFPGVIGSRGQATGPAALVITKHDLRCVKEGDVLVAVTTHPDFVPAMRKASAIVTDEGGITSHAAIVARELRIPCIVGSKLATTVLKDGDTVRVDAKKGMVTIV